MIFRKKRVNKLAKHAGIYLCEQFVKSLNDGSLLKEDKFPLTEDNIMTIKRMEKIFQAGDPCKDEKLEEQLSEEFKHLMADFERRGSPLPKD